MWISNTATAALMVPIVQSVISELVSNQRSGELIERQHLASRRRYAPYYFVRRIAFDVLLV